MNEIETSKLKMPMWRKVVRSALLIVPFAVLLVFNNCGPAMAPNMNAMNSGPGARQDLVTASPLDLFAYPHLISLIEGQRLYSIDKVVKGLPKLYKRHFTLVHSSKSLQGASPENPRAILFGPDAGLIMTFNGHLEQKGYHNLELMYWNETTRQMELREITFDPKGAQRPYVSEANPAKCMQCHSASPKPTGYVKPLMADYSTWNGFYGSRDDSIFKLPDYITSTNFLTTEEVGIVRAETANFLSFRERVILGKHPRYFELFGDHTADENFPFKPNVSGDYVSTTFDNAPNTRLTDLLYTRQAEQLAHRAKKSKFYEAFKYNLAAQSACRLEAPESLTSRLKSVVDQVSQRDVKGKLKQRFQTQSYDNFVAYRLLDHFSIVTRDEWNLTLGALRDEQTSLEYKTPTQKNEGLKRLFAHLAYDLLDQKIKESCSVFIDDFGNVSGSESPEDEAYLAYARSRWPSFNCAQACSVLSAKADQELTDIESQLARDPHALSDLHLDPSISDQSLPTGDARIPAVVNRCTGCHTEKNPNLQVGPFIPFMDPFQIGMWQTQIEALTSPNEPELRSGGRRMPFGQESLSADERAALLDYVSARP